MTDTQAGAVPLAVLERAAFPQLIDQLVARGYQVLGPTVRDGAIVYDRLAADTDLPTGWTEHQDAASYRLERRTDEALFGYAVGPHSWKKYLFPSAERLWQAERIATGFQVIAEPVEPPRYAFLGMRACELHALAIQDQVFLSGQQQDGGYAARRADLFIVAVNCGHAGGSCFCVSMQTGPQATAGFDLALTEVVDEARHYFVVEVGSPRGRELLQELPQRAATDAECRRAAAVVARTAEQMGRVLDTDGLKDLLYRNYEHPRWDDVAQRCLTCANCTMVCPTCFCSTVEDVTDLTGDHAERWRKWDSCFSVEFTHLHGGSVRSSTKSRYRQWLTHKLATWHDQFGSSGCVGCGRCITWCPVGIDITVEAGAIRASAAPAQQQESHDANA